MIKLDQFVTIKQAAKMLGVAPNTLRNWHRDAKLPVYRNPVSGYRLFKRTDLEQLLRQIEASGIYPTGWKRRATKPQTTLRNGYQNRGFVHVLGCCVAFRFEKRKAGTARSVNSQSAVEHVKRLDAI